MTAKSLTGVCYACSQQGAYSTDSYAKALAALVRLAEANDNLFRIKQKTVVENVKLKAELKTALNQVNSLGLSASPHKTDEAP
jgi:hypothetical protein